MYGQSSSADLFSLNAILAQQEQAICQVIVTIVNKVMIKHEQYALTIQEGDIRKEQIDGDNARVCYIPNSTIALYGGFSVMQANKERYFAEISNTEKIHNEIKIALKERGIELELTLQTSTVRFSRIAGQQFDRKLACNCYQVKLTERLSYYPGILKEITEAQKSSSSASNFVSKS